jgi:CheY-like chemotaxis protein
MCPRGLIHGTDGVIPVGDVVLCDVIMPGKSGREVGEEIRKLSREVRIVFMNGYPADIIHQKSLLEEAVEIILKPICFP